MSIFERFSRLFRGKEEIPVEMKYLICGLGNPGTEYEFTRHNVGFEVADAIVNDKSSSYDDDRHGFISTIKHKGRTLYILKPMTYMNLSGKAVRYWAQKHKIKNEHILVILDDLNLPFGTVRMRKKGNHGGHNGLKDIDATLGHSNYARLRIGIGDSFGKGQQVDYVLGKWTDKESEILPKIIKHAVNSIYAYATIGIDRAMNQANKKIIND